MSRIGGSARVSGDHSGDSLHMLKHGLHAPETASGEDRSLLGGGFSQRFVHGRIRNRPRSPGRLAGQETYEKKDSQTAKKKKTEGCRFTMFHISRLFLGLSRGKRRV